MKEIEVVAAIIYFEDKILCVQRPQNKLAYISKKFEFPGGKVENGETLNNALYRELKEELNFTPISMGELYLTVNHQYPDFKLIMHVFKCISDKSEIQLNEHISSQWRSLENLKKLDWAAADIPIVNRLIENG